MKVVVTGGTGFIGHALVRALVARGDVAVVLTRDASHAASAFRDVPETRSRLTSVVWDPGQAGAWQDELDGADVVVHLAGEVLVGRRHTRALVQRAHASRVRSAELLVDGMRRAARAPRVFVSGSAVGYYGDRGEEALDESASAGDDRLAHLCVDWEAAAAPAEALGVRVVRSRMGIVLGSGGGALGLMALPFRFFVGGPLGKGTQYISWVSLEDAVRALLFCIDEQGVTGPVNVTAPEPATNEQVSGAVAEALSRPSWLRVPAFALRAALGDGAEPVLGGQRVLPRKLLEHGFSFLHPRVQEAVSAGLG